MLNVRLKQLLTIITISEAMAHTQKTELEVLTVLDTPQPQRDYANGPVRGHRYGTARLPGKRKAFHLDIRTDALVFEGHGLPIVTDYEVRNSGGNRGFSGNACYNLGGPNPETVRDFIEHRNLNGPTTDAVKAICLYVPEGYNAYSDDGGAILLYPDIPVRHAVIDRMKEKAQLAA